MPVNESIWEHLKLILVPAVIFGIVYNLIYTNDTNKLHNFWYFVYKGIIISMLIIVSFYYIHKLIFKTDSFLFDILLYIISTILLFLYIYFNMKYQDMKNKNKNGRGICSLLFFFLIFILFTIYAPKLELFKDPVTNTFGIFMLK